MKVSHSSSTAQNSLPLSGNLPPEPRPRVKSRRSKKPPSESFDFDYKTGIAKLTHGKCWVAAKYSDTGRRLSQFSRSSHIPGLLLVTMENTLDRKVEETFRAPETRFGQLSPEHRTAAQANELRNPDHYERD